MTANTEEIITEKARRIQSLRIVQGNFHGRNGLDADTKLHLLKKIHINVITLWIGTHSNIWHCQNQLETFQNRIVKQILSSSFSAAVVPVYTLWIITNKGSNTYPSARAI